MNMRGRPRHYYVADREICKDCIYSKRLNEANGSNFHCHYILLEGHSRVYSQTEPGKRMVKKGYCDKFKSKKEWKLV